jgi:hypothetical protein
MTLLPRLAPRRSPLPRSSSACWQRRLARPVARSAAATQACAWVVDFVAAPRPRLQPEPLWGSCLAQMFAEGEERPSTPPRPKRSVKPGHTHSPPARAGKPEERHGSKPGKGTRPSLPTRATRPDLPPLPVQKIGQLLQRLAEGGAGERWTGRSGPTDQRPRATSFRANAGWPGRPGQPTAAVPTGPPAAEAVPAWQEKVSRRVARQLWPTTPQGRPLAALPPSPAVAKPAHADGAMLWQRPLPGPTASISLLQSLRQPGSASTDEQAAGRPHSQQQPAAPQSHRRPQKETAKEVRPAAEETHRSQLPAQTAVWPAPQPTVGQAAIAGGQPETWPASQPANRSMDGFAPGAKAVVPQTAPPQTGALLPSLRPMDHPAAAEPTVARETARRSAEREMETAVVDTTQLARQLKQILDEEARRYGIDV